MSALIRTPAPIALRSAEMFLHNTAFSLLTLRSAKEPTQQMGVERPQSSFPGVPSMHEIIYLIGLIVVVMFILGALGLR